MPRLAALSSITAALALAAVTPAGCVKRSETIRVAPDGTTNLTVVFEGDLDDVSDGDAMLEDPGPWAVKDEIKYKDDGEDELTRTATLTVSPGGDFPTQYAGRDAALASLALNFTTSLHVEKRPDGTYYHFRRVYHRRDWSHVDYFRKKHLEDELKKLEDKDQAEWTDNDRRSIAGALIAFEAMKTTVLAEEAANALEPPLPQDEWLAVHRRIWRVFREIDVPSVMEILQEEGDEAETRIAAAVREVNRDLEEAIQSALAERDPSGALAGAFMDQFDRERRRFAISEDLQDEHWEVVVQLPGRIIGHNAVIGHNAGGDDDRGGTVQWEFDGDALFDRDQMLMATSVVENR